MDKIIIFCHIPKTAGTTLRAILRREYGNQTRFLKLYGGRGDAQRLAEAYKRFSRAEKMQYGVIKGHYPVGIHAAVPGQSAYVTLLRDPHDRLVSFYHQVLNVPEHYAYEEGFTRETGLADFVRRKIAVREVWNGQVWYLSGGKATCSRPSDLLDRARQNIDELFAVAGLSERFDESVMLMRRRLGWRKLPLYYRRRVTSNRLPRDKIPPETQELIRRANLLDIELYHYVSKKFHEQIHAQGEQFAIELRLFRLANYLYQKFIELRFFAGKMKQRVFQG